MGCQIRELSYPDRYYLGHEGRMVSSSEANEHTDILHVHQIFERLAEEDPEVPDMSMAEYLHCKGVNRVVTQLAQSFYANDFGCSLEQLGLRECIEEAQQWIYGDTYLILDRPLSSIIEYLSQGLQVHLNWPVVRVEYTEDKGVRLWSQDGSTICADYLILTVPVKILQECIVEFDPPLPPSKLKSIQSIGMRNALKVIMAFSESFWPEDLFDVICTDCFLPEIWVTQYPDVANEAGKRAALGQFVVVGFMAGELAVAASQLSDGDILLQALSQLDSMFGTINGSTTLNAEPCSKPSCTFQDTTDTMNSDSQVLEPDGEMMDPFPGVAEMPRKLITRSELHHWETASWDWKLKPASTSFQGGYVMNWELQEYVRGGYTHPSLHAHGARSTLAEPLSGRVFFAGEATHPGVNPCLQAAFDTGQRAASEIIALANLSRL
ncbi:hypothetical protein CY35_01G191100 [Sphagnum magellanicum]|nr:hypothetical protein CY35_01G191100 [Sphagnum magellanicum]KAH9576990.1 hypothetical protein CY35_01G191100 [Sphagnum magellanicum]